MKNSFYICFLIVLFTLGLFLLTSCTDSQEKIVKNYVKEKYGFTPNIVEVKKVYSGSFISTWTGYYIIKCEYDGSEFLVSNYKNPSENYPCDDYENDKYIELATNYIKMALNYKPTEVVVKHSNYNKLRYDNTNIKDFINSSQFIIYTENGNMINLSEDEFHELFGDRAEGTIVNFRNKKPIESNLDLFRILLTDEVFETFKSIKDEEFSREELIKEFHSTIIIELYNNKDEIIDIYSTENVKDYTTFEKSVLNHYVF